MIRVLELKDYESAKKLVYQVHQLHLKNRPDIYIDGNPLPMEYFEKIIIDKNSLNYVYEEDGEIVGILTSSKQTSRPLQILNSRIVYFIDDIVVDNNQRRKGIGKKLFNHLLDKAKQDNVDAIELNVWSFNESAIKFYESLGMTVKNMKMEYIFNKDIDIKKSELIITNKVK